MRRALIVDLDVHQGDGTHALLAGDADAFTLSVNGFRNYPFRRVPGDLELDLPDGTGDDAYLDGLAASAAGGAAPLAPRDRVLPRGRRPVRGRPARPPGPEHRRAAQSATRYVRDTLRAAGVPVCVTLAGGYAEDIGDTVEINLGTVTTFSA